MPFLGLGVHLIIALFFAVHAMKTGKQMYWLIILFSFPLLGSIVYFLVEYLPSTRIERRAAQGAAAVVRALDPGRELRDAKTAFELSPTADNQQRIALALLNAGDAEAASIHFAECLAGPFGKEPDVRVGAARAALTRGRFRDAIEWLRAVRHDTPTWRASDVTVLLAQAYWADGDIASAGATYAEASRLYGDFDVKAEHVMFALDTGNLLLARTLQRDIDVSMKTWNRHTRKLNKDTVARLDAAWSKAGVART